ncbi:MAG: hypothetical protein R6U51_00695 [Anaerolineales bacterium]
MFRIERKERELHFGLVPFVVGFYEEQLPRLDQEMASLFEEYFQESEWAIAKNPVSFHRVIPIEESISFELEILSFECWGRRAEERGINFEDLL